MEGGLPDDTRRERFFRFSQFSDSVFDRGESSRLDYAKAGENGPLFGGMRDEVGFSDWPMSAAVVAVVFGGSRCCS